MGKYLSHLPEANAAQCYSEPELLGRAMYDAVNAQTAVGNVLCNRNFSFSLPATLPTHVVGFDSLPSLEVYEPLTAQEQDFFIKGWKNITRW
jgi:hypothetical protein